MRVDTYQVPELTLMISWEAECLLASQSVSTQSGLKSCGVARQLAYEK